MRDESLRGRQAGPRAGRSRKCVRRPSPEGQSDTRQDADSARMQKQENAAAKGAATEGREFRQDADAEGSLFRKDIVPEGRQSRKDAVPENSLQFNKKQPEIPAVSYFRAYLPFPATKMPHTLVPTAGIWVKGLREAFARTGPASERHPSQQGGGFYAEQAQPAAAPPLRKVIKGKKHVFIPCVLAAVDRFSVREAWCR